MPSRRPAPRFDREAWLRAAMEALAREGQAKLNVEKLAADLGVTKGSFYHHFRNREDFVTRVAEYWAHEYTLNMIETLGGLPGPQRLFRAMLGVLHGDLDRFEMAFRSWAAQDASVARVVRRVDTARYRFIRSAFADIGFTGAELRERTRIWLVFHSGQRAVHIPDAAPVDEALVAWRFRFFTGIDPEG